MTHDTDYLVLSAQGPLHAGIAYCHPGKYTLGQLLRAPVLVWEVYESDELYGRVEYR